MKLRKLAIVGAAAFFLFGCSASDDSAQSTSSDEATSSELTSEADSDANSEADADTVPQAQETEIYVFIAASLNDAMTEIASNYNESHPEVTITYNADSSGTLLTQIENGYACDIFFSAATKQMDALEEDGLMVDGSRVDLLKNQLVLITWKGSNTAVTGFDNLSDASSLALADGSVPVGKYTRDLLVNMGILTANEDGNANITTQEVSEALGGIEINECGNVSKVKEAVKEHSNEVGTVYYSDAYSVKDDVDIIAYADEELTGSILYPVALVENAEADEAESNAASEFLAYLQTDEAISIFEKYMFIYAE